MGVHEISVAFGGQVITVHRALARGEGNHLHGCITVTHFQEIRAVIVHRKLKFNFLQKDNACLPEQMSQPRRGHD